MDIFISCESYSLARMANGKPYPTWADWYRAERQDSHEKILWGACIECRIGEAAAMIPMDSGPALAKWIKGAKAPAKRGRKPGSKNAKPPTHDLITATLTLLSRIQARDPEGNVIPPWMIAPVMSALEGV